MGLLLKILSSLWLNLGLNLALGAVILWRGYVIDNLKIELSNSQKSLNLARLELRFCNANLDEQNKIVEKNRLKMSEFRPLNLRAIDKIAPANKACKSELAAYKALFGGVK